jgi:microcystin-dependent protein
MTRGAPISQMNTVVAINGAAGTPRSALGYTLTSARWELQLGSITAETGGDLGSDLVVIPYNDAGIAKAPVFTIQRSTGTATFAVQPNLPGYATTAYVDNSVNNAIAVAEAHATPVGSVTMFAGAAAPSGWLICDGSSLSTVTYATLFAILGYTYGGSGANFNIPNLQGTFPIGAGGGYTLGSAGGAATVTLDATMMPYHAHAVEQTPHAHGYSDPSHYHAISDPSHTHPGSVASHNHNVPNGLVPNPVEGVEGGLGSGFFPTGSTTDYAAPAFTVGAAYTGINSTGYSGVGISISGAYANINGNQTDAAGGNQPHENRPPYLTMNFIIKYQ